MIADETDSGQVSVVATSGPELDPGLAPQPTEQDAVPRENEDDMRSGQEKMAGLAATAEPIAREQLNRLYSGEDRRYVERPEVEEERQHSIEMAARIAAGDTQINGQWQVLRDEEALEPEIRAEIEERGGVDTIPVNEDFVLARDGRVMYRTQLQHALERELRDRMGVPESWESDTKRILWHKEQLARLEKADAAPRCEHIYSDGTTCQAPKLRQDSGAMPMSG
jgi:hypothetical protein